MPPRQRFLPRENEMLFYFLFCKTQKFREKLPDNCTSDPATTATTTTTALFPTHPPAVLTLELKLKSERKTVWRLFRIENISQKIFDCCSVRARLPGGVGPGLAWPGNTSTHSADWSSVRPSFAPNQPQPQPPASLPSTPTNHNIGLHIFKIKFVINYNNQNSLNKILHNFYLFPMLTRSQFHLLS